jgi:hypothetical protein
MLPSHVQSTLTVTPTIPLQPTAPYIPQNPIGTVVHHRMQNPTTHVKSSVGQTLTGGKPLSSGPIPPEGKLPLHISTRGKPPFIGQTPVITQSMVGGQPSFIGNPPQSWGPPQGGMFHQNYQGGPSYPNP